MLRKGLPTLPKVDRKMANKRSVTPNGDAIRSARLRKAWTTDDLSRHADCAVKTIENAERGKAIYANTLACIALGVDYDSLIAGLVEQKKPTDEQKLTWTPDRVAATTRVEAVFLLLRRQDQPIDSDWFLDQLKRRVAFQDSIEVLDNRYDDSCPLMPEGGVRIALAITARDYEKVFEYLTTKPVTELKVVYLGAADVCIRDQTLWYAQSAWCEPPHSHLYD